MLLQGAVDREGHAADLTLEDLLGPMAVRLHVAGQLAALGAGVRTELTLVGLLSRVN